MIMSFPTRLICVLAVVACVALPVLSWTPAASAAGGESSTTVAAEGAGNDEGQGPDGPVRAVAALGGYVAYGLIVAVVVWGLLTTTGIARNSVRRNTIYRTHTSLAVAALSFTFMHAISYYFQKQEQFSLVKVFVPLVGGGEPEVAMGIVGFELMAAISITICFQRSLGYRRWHKLHWFAYPAFVLALAHTVATAKEAQEGLGAIAIGVTVLLVVYLFVLRAWPGKSGSRGRLGPVEL